MNVEENVPLAPLTTFRIGGPARYFVTAKSDKDVQEAVAFAHKQKVPLFVLGGGSNILVADEGFDGLVLSIRIPGVTHERRGDKVLVTSSAGVVWDDLVAWTIERGFAGFECLSGVPGTVGGAVAVNLGCYGAQVSDTLVSVDAVDRRDGTLSTLIEEDCDFSYHDSVFASEPERYVVMRAVFALSSSDPSPLTYKDSRFDLTALASRLGRLPTLMDIRNAILDVREQKGNLVMEGRLSYRGAGSFFHMPFVSPERYKTVEAKARSLDAEKEERLRPWAWRQPDASYRIAPGFLLEFSPFQKGYTRGPVGISPRHILAIINLANAHAQDVAELARDMQDEVERVFDIRLEREVEYVGFA